MTNWRYFSSEKRELVFRGSENDVLDRYIKAAEANCVDGIVRICSIILSWTGMV